MIYQYCQCCVGMKELKKEAQLVELWPEHVLQYIYGNFYFALCLFKTRELPVQWIRHPTSAVAKCFGAKCSMLGFDAGFAGSKAVKYVQFTFPIVFPYL